MRISLAAVLALMAWLAPASADPVAVQVEELSSFSAVPSAQSFGSLEWRGGIELSSGDDRFGGLSSLAMAADGKRFLAVSDAGFWFAANVAYEDGRLSGLSGTEIAPILDDKGRLVRAKWRNDAEALALLQPGKLDGEVAVGFESRTRAGTYDLGKDGFKASFRKLPLPLEVKEGPGNRELESIGVFTSGPHEGRFIAISELNRTAEGGIKAWIFGGGEPLAFAIKQHEDFAITDSAFLPDGRIVTVERSYEETGVPGVAIRVFRPEEIAAGATVVPRLLMEARAPVAAVDNMEGIGVHVQDGETRLTLVSDNNYSPRFQRTLILQFALKE
jgi:hypothetical protein